MLHGQLHRSHACLTPSSIASRSQVPVTPPRPGKGRAPHAKAPRAMAGNAQPLDLDPREQAEAHPGSGGNVSNQKFPGEESKMEVKPDFGYDTYKGNDKLRGKIALVTGADSGIGRAVALAFAREGAHVAIAYLNEHEDAKETQRVVEEAGVEALLLPGDLSKQETIEGVVAQTVERFGRIDILVNNASAQYDAVDFLEMTRERVQHTVDTNILGYFFLSQAAVPHMAPGSAIINTTSIQAYDPSSYIVDYATTKGAIVTLTKGLSGCLLESKGIRVNAVAPGPVWTPLIVESFPQEKVKKHGQQAPLGRAAQPRDYGPPFVFLATNSDSGYISGEILAVTGGLLLT